MESSKNEILSPIGPDTEMGKLFRRHWLPALTIDIGITRTRRALLKAIKDLEAGMAPRGMHPTSQQAWAAYIITPVAGLEELAKKELFPGNN
jgi:hypothetical protein